MSDQAVHLESASIEEIKAFIAKHWDETVRSCPKDDGTLTGLPFPYTIPCRKGAFQELYYWDTYFTALGLIGSGRADLAVNNTRNLMAQVERFGFVPNGNRTYYTSRSQPPYLGPLVGLVADATGDQGLIRDAVPLLKREHEFWVTRRLTPTGLSHHGSHATDAELIEFFPTVKHRLGQPNAIAEENLDLARRTMAECETGWDLNSRFDRRCPDFCAVDLNSNLWLYEKLLSQWAPVAERAEWSAKADARRALLNTLCWDEARGAFFDYDHVNKRRSDKFTAATFQPLWTGLATQAQADAVVANALPKLEFAFGVSSVAPGEKPSPYQWDHPNGWPCIQHLVYRGLSRYGFQDDARRIAEKYIESVSSTFVETGDLWEKYNVLDGSHRTVAEAGYLINPVNLAEGTADAEIEEVPPAMMGWTAGVFLDAVGFLQNQTPFWLVSKS